MNPTDVFTLLDTFVAKYTNVCQLSVTQFGAFRQDAVHGILLSILTKSKDILPQDAWQKANGDFVWLFQQATNRELLMQNIADTVREFCEHLISHTSSLSNTQKAE